jgi:hypothetical protein
MMSARERNVDFKMFSYEEALAADPIVDKWISFAQNAALDAHTYILEDGPELPKSSSCGRSRRSLRARLHDDRRIEDARKIRKDRRPSFSSGGAIRSCRHCFEGPPDRTNVITILRQNMKFCR